MKEVMDLGIKLCHRFLPWLFICLLANLADAKNYELVPKNKNLELISESEANLLTSADRLREATKRAGSLCDRSGGVLFSMSYAPMASEKEICSLNELSLPDPPLLTLLEGGIVLTGISALPWCFCGIFGPIDYQKLSFILANSTMGVSLVLLVGWGYGNVHWHQGAYGTNANEQDVNPVVKDKDTVCVNIEAATKNEDDKSNQALACIKTSDPNLHKIKNETENAENKAPLSPDKTEKEGAVRLTSLLCAPKNMIYDWILRLHESH